MRVPTMKKDLVPAVMKYNDGVYLRHSIATRAWSGMARSSGPNGSGHASMAVCVATLPWWTSGFRE